MKPFRQVIAMDQDRVRELLAGYALNSLEEDEYAEVQLILENDPQARVLLAEFEELTAGLALTAPPVDLPAGSLNRLRLKAGVAADPPATQPQVRPPTVNPAPAVTGQPPVVDIS